MAVKETIDETHTSQTYMHTKDIPGFCVMEANEPLLLPSYAIGIDAAFSIIFNLLPREMRGAIRLGLSEERPGCGPGAEREALPIFDLMEEGLPRPGEGGSGRHQDARWHRESL